MSMSEKRLREKENLSTHAVVHVRCASLIPERERDRTCTTAHMHNAPAVAHSSIRAQHTDLQVDTSSHRATFTPPTITTPPPFLLSRLRPKQPEPLPSPPSTRE
jgi:hypothetical protein